ncbi:helix-turn-helix domain-containing protein [Enterococcus hulanensis]|uniref:helix-turn-helix domain-containing protein n=1 Tax=Enterococcus hulanensis TaxID=2559929 RepID=UPI001A8FA278|nr:helix-turn-helix domain-containing protein [Enterococcus hulanensis]MBO0460036.1 helix-turn-helix domain-containing protein [Enterococcus hulanensis]
MRKNQDETKQIGIRLQQLRKKKGFSQEQLSNQTGISRSTLAKYEKGLRSISEDNLKLLSMVLDTDEIFPTNDEEVEEIIQNLIRYQEINRLSKKDVATRTGIASSTLTRILNGDRKPSASIIKKISLLFSDSSESIAQKITSDDGVHSFPAIDREEMGNRIHEIRKDREESLKNFGKQLTQVTGKNVISRWEKGINIPDIEKLMNIAYIGNTTVPYLLFGPVYEKMIIAEKRKKMKFKKLDPIYMGRRLRKIRKDYKLEREDFGKMFDPPIRKWSMDRYENGKDIPNTERIVQYAFLGKVSLEFLIYGT